MKILVTGSAGFIGFHATKKLLEEGHTVIGVDNLNEYYDVSLKLARNELLKQFKNYFFFKENIANKEGLFKIFGETKPNKVLHLAAQAGVRYSLENPFVYEESNQKGFLNIIEACKNHNIPLVYASSSSVYGLSEKSSFSESDRTDKPISLYAATKKSNEETAFVYHHLFKVKSIGLRFFTVGGPFGRPDMALFSFTKNILEGKPIKLFNEGKMKRDFTFVSDIVEGIVSALKKDYDYEVINLARGESRELIDFVRAIEKYTKKKAIIELHPLQKGDVLVTSGDISKAKKLLNYEPRISLGDGVKEFVEWFKEYYKK